MPPASRAELADMAGRCVEMLDLLWQGFRRQDTAPFEEAAKLGREIHAQEKALTAAAGDLLFVPMHLERVGDNLEALQGAVTSMVREGVPFTERAMREIGSLFERTVEQLECLRDAVITENRVLLRHVIESGRQHAQLADDYALAHQRRLVEGVCLPRASSLYLAMLDYFKGVGAHARKIAEQLAPRGHPARV